MRLYPMFQIAALVAPLEFAVAQVSAPVLDTCDSGIAQDFITSGGSLTQNDCELSLQPTFTGLSRRMLIFSERRLESRS